MKKKLFLTITAAMIALAAAAAFASPKSVNYSEMTETHIGDAVADAMREATGADIALINAGSLGYKNLPDRITKDTVSDIVPFGSDEIVVVKMKGEDIAAALEKSYALLPRSSASFLQVSGLDATYDLNQPAGRRLVSLRIGGKAVKKGEIYEVATTDYLASGGGGLSAFRNGKKTDMDPIELEAALLQYMRFDIKKINTSQNRIMVILPDEE